MKIRYYGHVGVPTGFGVAAAEMCMAILGAGHDLEISTDGTACHPRYLPLARCFRDEPALSTPDAVIVHTLPLDCAMFLQKRQIRERYPDALCVACTTWEGASKVPTKVAASFAAFDRVWVPSSVTARSCMISESDPVQVVPHPFEEATWDPFPSPPPRQPYRFYYIGAWTARKNVAGLIRAYLRTFDADDDVELVIQSAGAGPSVGEVAILSTGLADGPVPTIRFSNRRMTDEEIWALHRECHCFVTATRGEAWNLPAFDAMLAQRHVIAPSGMGHVDFLRDTSARFYGVHPVPAFGDVQLVDAPDAPPGHAAAHYVATQGMTARSDWYEPDLIELGIHMKRAYAAHGGGGGDDPLWVGYDPRVRYGRVAVGRLITQILEGARH
jgi:glycosyltransferase involved in cell wall biosynthesis